MLARLVVMNDRPDSSKDQSILGATACLYAATALNTLIYDTIYGHQDLQDDLRAGVKSVAVAWRDDTKRNCAVLAVIEVALLATAGGRCGLWPGILPRGAWGHKLGADGNVVSR